MKRFGHYAILKILSLRSPRKFVLKLVVSLPALVPPASQKRKRIHAKRHTSLALVEGNHRPAVWQTMPLTAKPHHQQMYSGELYPHSVVFRHWKCVINSWFGLLHESAELTACPIPYIFASTRSPIRCSYTVCSKLTSSQTFSLIL